MKTQIDNFTHAYLHAILWSTNDESTPQGGEPLDSNYDVSDFSQEAVEKASADCARFQAENAESLEVANIQESRDTCSRAGFLFALDRNGHGTGFWDEKTHNDSDSEREACDRLSDASKAFGEVYAYVGNDGKIHF